MTNDDSSEPGDSTRPRPELARAASLVAALERLLAAAADDPVQLAACAAWSGARTAEEMDLLREAARWYGTCSAALSVITLFEGVPIEWLTVDDASAYHALLREPSPPTGQAIDLAAVRESPIALAARAGRQVARFITDGIGLCGGVVLPAGEGVWLSWWWSLEQEESASTLVQFRPVNKAEEAVRALQNLVDKEMIDKWCLPEVTKMFHRASQPSTAELLQERGECTA